MNSVTLRGDLNSFIDSVDEYNGNVNNHKLSVNNINKDINAKNNMRFLYDYLWAANSSLIKDMNKLVSGMDKVKENVNQNAQKKIRYYESLELKEK